jgi:hypothetical protein
MVLLAGGRFAIVVDCELEVRRLKMVTIVLFISFRSWLLEDFDGIFVLC